MKKLKWILLIIAVIMIFIIAISSCKKTKALTSAFNGFNLYISERAIDEYNAVLIFDLGNQANSSYNFMFINGTGGNYIFINVTANNTLSILESGVGSVETIALTSRLIEIDVVEDNGLYIIIYEINYITQVNQGQVPIIDGISRTMKTRFNIGSFGGILNKWQNDDLQLRVTNDVNASVPFLVNCSYISLYDTPTDISNWVNLQLSNYTTYNKLIVDGYLAGNVDGYSDGFSDGEERGYSDGYDAGEDAGYLVGHAEGLEQGLNEGYTDGYGTGYDDGYNDGEAGETAVSRTVTLLGSIFGAVGSVMSIELFPNVPLGLFFLVPLFFAVIGLILWIWRRN